MIGCAKEHVPIFYKHDNGCPLCMERAAWSAKRHQTEVDYHAKLKAAELERDEARHQRKLQVQRADLEAASASRMATALVTGAEIRNRVATTLRRMLAACSDPVFVFGEPLARKAEKLAAEMEGLKAAPTPNEIEAQAWERNRIMWIPPADDGSPILVINPGAVHEH
jgi:hypothetical protein